MDMEEPRVRQSNKLMPVEPSEKRPSMTPLPLIEKELPSLAIDLKLMALPIRATSQVDIDEPRRAMLRTERDEPSCTSPSIETSAPIIALKKSEHDDPIDAMLLTLHALPKLAKSRKLCGPPNLENPLKLMDDPMETKENTLKELPKRPIPHSESIDPHLAFDLIDT
jgi:hypothetical protein